MHFVCNFVFGNGKAWAAFSGNVLLQSHQRCKKEEIAPFRCFSLLAGQTSTKYLPKILLMMKNPDF